MLVVSPAVFVFIEDERAIVNEQLDTGPPSR